MKTPSRMTFIEHCILGVALLALGALCVRHGENPLGFVKEWAAGLEFWPRSLLRIALMAVFISSVDLNGRYVASAVAGHRDVVSPRKLAAIRMTVVAALIVCVALALIFAPETFPCTAAWKVVCIFGAMLVPLIFAFADWRKAKKEV